MAGRVSARTGLAVGSIRHRRNSYLAGFVAVLLGSAVLTSFAALLDIGLQPGIARKERTTLIIMASVVGGWGAVVVGAAVATTLALTTRQRVRELALLRSIGATPRQVVRMITAEVAVVALLAVAIAAPIGTAGSVVLLHLLESTGQVGDSTPYRVGPITYGIGAGAPLVAAVLAAFLTARRAAARRVRDGLFQAATGGRTVGRVRKTAGWVLLAGGFGNAVTTLIVCRGANPADSQSIASEGAIAGSIGFALLAPVLLEWVVPRLDRIFAAFGVGGRLAQLNLRERIQQAATPIMPVVIVTGIASGTLSMQAVANEVSGEHLDKGTALLNYVIVGIISALAAAMLVNMLVAATAERRREHAQLRLIGATPDQLLQALRIETAVVTGIGLVAGTIAAAFTAVPFSLAQGTGVLPLTALVIQTAVIVAVALLSYATTLRTGRRTLRSPAMAALAVAA